jgi:hypothetical protein
MAVFIRLEDGRLLDYYTFWDSVRECQAAFVNDQPITTFINIANCVNCKIVESAAYAAIKAMDSASVAYCLYQAFESVDLHPYSLAAQFLKENDATLDKAKKLDIRDAARRHAIR